MYNLGLFCKEPGSDLPKQTEHIISSTFDVMRPQLTLLQERFFNDPNSAWTPAAFTKFIRFPVIAGYALGLIGEIHQSNAIPITDMDKLRCVIHVDSHFTINRMDLSLSMHHAMQQPVFRFGLATGIADVEMNRAVMAQGGRASYALLAALCNILLTYEDDRTLILNLRIFHSNYGLKATDVDFAKLASRWNEEKTYSILR